MPEMQMNRIIAKVSFNAFTVKIHETPSKLHFFCPSNK